ncbi:hypothetical protein [Haloferula sp.]
MKYSLTALVVTACLAGLSHLEAKTKPETPKEAEAKKNELKQEKS